MNKNLELTFEKRITECPNCGNKRFAHFGGRNHFDYRIEYKICRHCSLIVQDPQMDEATTENFYKHHYRALYNGNAAPTEKEIEIQTLRGRNQVTFLKNYLKNHHTASFNNYLDIGCSTGSHLMELKKQYPAVELNGVEPGDGYREYCSDLGIITYPSVENVAAEGKKFDIINMSHVLEHIPDPAAFLRYLKNNLLKKDGILMLEVPNTVGGHGAFEIAHPVCFHRKTLADTLSLGGFDDIRIETHSVTKEGLGLPEMYLLAAARSGKENTSFTPGKYNAWKVKFLRRRGYKAESFLTTAKILLRAYLFKK